MTYGMRKIEVEVHVIKALRLANKYILKVEIL